MAQLLSTTIYGNLSLAEQLNVGSAANGYVTIFGANTANRMMVSAISSSGASYSLQPFMGKTHVGFWNPQAASATAPIAFGLAAPTANGSLNARTSTTTNIFTRTSRLGYIGAAATNSVAGYRLGATQFTTGGDGVGGFFYTHRFGIADGAVPANPTMFIGFSSSSAAPANGVANTANSIGIGLVTGSNNFQLCYGGSTAQPRIDFGSTFIANTSNDAIFELSLYSPYSTANTSNAIFYYSVTKINSSGSFVTSGSVEGGSTIVPTSTTLLALQNWRSPGGSASVVGLDLISLYIETDY